MLKRKLAMVGAAASLSCLLFTTPAQAFTFGYNADALQVIAAGDISKGFYQTYSGKINKLELISRGSHRLYELQVTEDDGSRWVYRYNASNGKLVSKQGRLGNRLVLQ